MTDRLAEDHGTPLIRRWGHRSGDRLLGFQPCNKRQTIATLINKRVKTRETLQISFTVSNKPSNIVQIGTHTLG
jgi:hypothetical protein